MEKIYELDFASLSDGDKQEFMDQFSEWAEDSFSEAPFAVQIQAQLLIFTRWWNSYRWMDPEEPAPQILELAVQQLWDAQEGRPQPEFWRFCKHFTAAAAHLLTGDDSQQAADPACAAFDQTYFQDWPMFYNVFLSGLAGLLEEMTTHEINWAPVEEMLFGDIGDLKIEIFEAVYTNPTGGYRPSECERRDGDILRSKTFCRVVALLQEDMRAALSGRPVAQLREDYRAQYLFSPEECAQITSD